ncbi:hypothetical protein [Nannocystis bainbridge]|uniref:Uncharacterized protein n=1 Tax=Nannocystis bainbridge TaxID=2995303 RepID=A0ABT5EDW0_9BACT|nr:hypothetical protein [Nannocystis bainbridge]MDC0723590.1 hypothetical protein [Nannocystis bainbridge]
MAGVRAVRRLLRGADVRADGQFHRYFAHRAFKTSRPFQFLLALLGSTTLQAG